MPSSSCRRFRECSTENRAGAVASSASHASTTSSEARSRNCDRGSASSAKRFRNDWRRPRRTCAAPSPLSTLRRQFAYTPGSRSRRAASSDTAKIRRPASMAPCAASTEMTAAASSNGTSAAFSRSTSSRSVVSLARSASTAAESGAGYSLARSQLTPSTTDPFPVPVVITPPIPVSPVRRRTRPAGRAPLRSQSAVASLPTAGIAADVCEHGDVRSPVPVPEGAAPGLFPESARPTPARASGNRTPSGTRGRDDRPRPVRRADAGAQWSRAGRKAVRKRHPCALTMRTGTRGRGDR